MTAKPTLTLKRPVQPDTEKDDKTGGARTRSGARARRIEQMTQQRTRQQAQQQVQRQTQPQPHTQQSTQKQTPTHTPAQKRTQRQKPMPAPRQAAQRQPDMVFQVFTPCPQGLEAALAQELQGLGFASAKAGRAGCHVQADWHGVQRINLFSRLATRVLVKLSGGPVAREDDILALAHDTPWERWFGPEHRLRVDTSAVRSPMKSLHYCNLRAKDGICDRLREIEGARPDIDTVRPDARVHLFLDERSATLYLDTSGESLFKRGWRLDKGAAPIRENLAAGMLALAGWTPDAALLDPFCGSGTILIEAAYQALGWPAGIMRPFAFERLRHHDRQAWFAYKDALRAGVGSQLPAPIVGVDVDAAAIAAAQANARRAGLDGLIQFQTGNACEFAPPAAGGCTGGCIVTNPPYGERLAAEDEQLWPAWASHLKQHYSGWQVHVISNDMRLPQHLRLQARRRHPLHNGALDCRLFSFDMVAAKYGEKSGEKSGTPRGAAL